MKVLWVTNQPIGDAANILKIKAVSGQWLNAELENEQHNQDKEIVIVTIGNEELHFSKDNIEYFILKQGNIVEYKINDVYIREWEELFNKTKPDVIIVWGTEYAIGLAALIANNHNHPSAIFIQGVMKSIYENYRGGLTDKEIRAITTIQEKIRHNSIFDIEKDYERRTENEKEMILHSDYVILENTWSENIYKSINPSIKILKTRLPIKNEFSMHCWEYSTHHSQQLITTAAGYPLKGLHQLIKALVIVKGAYPDFNLIVPGNNMFFVHGIKNRIRQKGYHRYVQKLIFEGNIKDNILFCGPLSSEQYGEKMAESEIFICPSAIENHSSSLREAMTVGVPCIASRVGGIPEFGIDGENCLLYDYSNYKELAEKIMMIFSDGDLQKKLSTGAKKTIDYLYNKEPLLSMNEIYNIILNVRGD